MSEPSDKNLRLPYGWIEQVDPQTHHVFYVDTKAVPPRSIWVHPYEDDQFLREHPDLRDKLKSRTQASNSTLEPPPAYSRRHSYGGKASAPQAEVAAGTLAPGTPPKKRGFFDKMKDKAIASLEEKQRRHQAMQLEQQRMYPTSQQMYQQQYSAPQYAYPQRGVMGRRSGFGGGGMALPILGGLAGGMLLGDIMDGGLIDGGGDFGGGDFGGGDFGGGF
ncbi:hypothetical protein BDQ17DRAFT_1404118 [Cyathus striatus]|nr:hypothetical protein BDQ17DRAFT_1404118 [Cyathus striatus]